MAAAMLCFTMVKARLGTALPNLGDVCLIGGPYPQNTTVLTINKLGVINSWIWLDLPLYTSHIWMFV